MTPTDDGGRQPPPPPLVTWPWPRPLGGLSVIGSYFTLPSRIQSLNCLAIAVAEIFQGVYNYKNITWPWPWGRNQGSDDDLLSAGWDLLGHCQCHYSIEHVRLPIHFNRNYAPIDWRRQGGARPPNGWAKKFFVKIEGLSSFRWSVLRSSDISTHLRFTRLTFDFEHHSYVYLLWWRHSWGPGARTCKYVE